MPPDTIRKIRLSKSLCTYSGYQLVYNFLEDDYICCSKMIAGQQQRKNSLMVFQIENDPLRTANYCYETLVVNFDNLFVCYNCEIVPRGNVPLKPVT